MKKLYFVYNPRSGSAPSLAELKAKCKQAEVTIEKFIPIDDNLKTKLKKPIANGAILIVLGGDGTMNTLANLLVHTKAVMAPLSGGTFNHFTRGLKTPQNLDAALRNIKTAKMQKIDVVSVNGIYFVNNSMLGLYPHSLQIRSTLQDTLGKWPAAIIAVVRTLAKFHTYHMYIGKHEYHTPYVFIGNNHFGLEELGLPGRKRFDSGEMSVYVAHARNRWTVAKLTVMAALRRLHDADEFAIVPVGKEFTVETKRKRMRVSHDGELSHVRTPLVYTMHPKKLNILA